MKKQQMNKKFWRTFLPVFLEALGVVIVILIFLWTKKTAYYSFSNTPCQYGSEIQKEVQIKENESVSQFAGVLQISGIVDDKNYILIRYYCSDYRRYNLIPGEYFLSPSMGVDDILSKCTGRQQ